MSGVDLIRVSTARSFGPEVASAVKLLRTWDVSYITVALNHGFRRCRHLELVDVLVESPVA